MAQTTSVDSTTRDAVFESLNLDSKRHRTTVTAEVTKLIAAITLADEAFPRASALPRLAPVPYNHLGHQVLLDYHSLAVILWGTVQEIQETVRNSPRRYIAPLAGLLLLGLGICLGLLGSIFPELPLYRLGLVGTGGALGMLV